MELNGKTLMTYYLIMVTLRSFQKVLFNMIYKKS
jgi:hypothetical protein